MNELSLSVNSSTTHQLDTCLNSFMEHDCNGNALCKKYCHSAKKMFLEHQQTVDDPQSLSNTLRSLGDRKLNRYREQVFHWLNQICECFIGLASGTSPTKINDRLLHERLTPMTRATFIRELADTLHCKQGQTPDLALLYRVYSESGTKIPLSDWFEVRKSAASVREMFTYFACFCSSHFRPWWKNGKWPTMINRSCKRRRNRCPWECGVYFRSVLEPGLCMASLNSITSVSRKRPYSGRTTPPS